MNREYYGKLIFELSRHGRKGYKLPENGCTPPSIDRIPAALMRDKAPVLPEVDEPTVVRHYNNMSTNNFGVDTGFYPLGSCTMKYNPKINEEIAADRRMARLHPLQPDYTVQGALKLYYTLQSLLSESLCGSSWRAYRIDGDPSLS